LTKYQDGDHLNLVEHCISTFIHLLDQKTLFNHIHTLFYPDLAISSIFLIQMKKNWQKKITFIWQNVEFFFEMVQSNPVVLGKKGLLGRY